MRRHAGAGIPHYWLIDVDVRSVETYELGPEGYRVTGMYRPGDVLQPALFPGLEVPIDRIWP